MKTLYVIRHAKSGRKDDSSLKDFDRPLNGRGEKEAAWAGGRVKEGDLQVLVSSPAKRALDTASAVAKAIKYPSKNIVTDITMYESSVNSLLKVIKNLDDRCERAAIFGHNPEFSYLLSDLCEDDQDEMPTAGIGCVQFDVQSWKGITKKKGKLLFWAAPPKFDDA